jgi:hypothetical protein
VGDLHGANGKPAGELQIPVTCNRKEGQEQEIAIGRWAYQAKKEEEEQLNVVLFVNEIKIIMSLKDYTVCIACVPTRRISYMRIWYTFRISTDWQHIGSLVQRTFNFWSNVGIQYVTLLG